MRALLVFVSSETSIISSRHSFYVGLTESDPHVIVGPQCRPHEGHVRRRWLADANFFSPNVVRNKTASKASSAVSNFNGFQAPWHDGPVASRRNNTEAITSSSRSFRPNFRIADLHVSLCQEKNALLLTRAYEERTKHTARIRIAHVCLSALVPAFAEPEPGI